MAKLWWAEPEFLKSYQEKILNITPQERADAQSQFGNMEYDPEIMSLNGDTANISINGFLSKSGPDFIDRYFGIPGCSYDQILACLAQIESNPMVQKVNLLIDSPGGAVDNVDDVWSAIYNLGKSKAITAINCGLMASAAYYLGSPAKEIVALNPACLTGSIGVVISMYDFSAAYDKAGIKKVTIVSKNAPNKAPDVSKAEGIDVLQGHVDALERIFYARVALGRNVSTEKIAADYGQGWVLVAQDPDPMMPDAVRNGLIDRVDSKINISKIKAPAVAGENTSSAESPLKVEECEMKLDELLNANPDAKAQFDKLQTERFEAGVKAGQEKVEARNKLAVPYLASTSPYPAQIKDLAAKVVSGEMSGDALVGAVTVYDAMNEKKKSEDAQAETEKQGSTADGSAASGAQVGAVIDTAEAAVALAKELKGQGVK